MRPGTLDKLMAITVLGVTVGAYVLFSGPSSSRSTVFVDQRLQYNKQRNEETRQRLLQLNQGNNSLEYKMTEQNTAPVYVRRTRNSDGTTDIELKFVKAEKYRINWDVTTK